MTQSEKRLYLIRAMLKERPEYSKVDIPESESERKKFLRALFNLRPPMAVSDDFLSIQNSYLKEEIKLKGITKASELTPLKEGICLWQGDITTLACDVIVNAANSEMLGCFCPNHGCIDNAVHTYAGTELRFECARIMEKQGFREPTGRAKLTSAYNLPSKYILHTVGPIIAEQPTARDEELLRSCYMSCLESAQEKGFSNIAFCCISTGEFRFPNERAARIAIAAAEDFRKQTKSEMKVIFNVYKDRDLQIYRRLLGFGGAAE